MPPAAPSVDAQHQQRLADGKACLEAALRYLALGWAVLPLCPPDHVGIASVSKHHRKRCKNPGKVPWIEWKVYQNRLPSEEEVRHWWHQLPNSNLGGALGPVSNAIRVDVEGGPGEAALQAKSNGDIPITLEFTSGRADGTGRGLIYRIPPGAKIRTTYEKYGEKTEIRFQAKGAQTVLPPSRHHSGSLYVWKQGCDPFSIQPSLAPDWLLGELAVKVASSGTGYQGKSQEEWDAIFEGGPEGGRNDSAAAYVGKLLGALKEIDNGSDLRAIFAGVEAWNERNDPPMDDDELHKTFASILRAEKAKREQADLESLDRKVASQIAEANGNGDCHPTNGQAPDWHLKIVSTEPDEEYHLRSPLWSNSKVRRMVKSGGYLILSPKQIYNWNGMGEESIPFAAWKQAREVVPLKIKNWNKPGGQLEQLKDAAHLLDASPERKRALYVLGFIYCYLKDAQAPRPNSDGKLFYPPQGRPMKEEDGSVVFKIAHLKSHIKECKEDFRHAEVTALLEENGFVPAKIQTSRWWKITKEGFAAIGAITKEGDE